jgi:hypothetical protein
VIFAVAGVLHSLHGRHDIGGLFGYSTAVLVNLAFSNAQMAESGHVG